MHSASMATHTQPQRHSQRHSTQSHPRLLPLLFSTLLALLACSSSYLLSVRAHAGSVEEPGPPFAHCDVFRIALVSASGSQDLWIADRGQWGEPLERGQYQPIQPIRTTSPIPADAVRVDVEFQRASGTVMRSVTTCVVNGGFVQYFRAPASASPPEDATALPTFALELQGLINGVNSITINTDCAEYFYGTIVIDDGTSGGGGGDSTAGDGSNGGGGETGPQDPGTGGGGETGGGDGTSGPAEPQDPQACELSALSFAPFPNDYAFALSPAFEPQTTSYTGVLPADVFLLSMKPELALGATSAAIVTLVVNGATPLVLTAGQESASIPLAQEIGSATNTIELKVTSGAACTKSYSFVFDRASTLSDGSQAAPGQTFFNWAVGSWGPCSASCGPGVTQRSVGCQASDNSFVLSFQNCTKVVQIDSDNNGIPDDTGSETAARPESEVACNLTPCAGGLDQAGSSTGAAGPVLSTMCARYAQASFGLGGSVTSQTRFVKAILRRALDGCGSNICNPSFQGILGDSSPYRTGEATSSRAEKLRANADSYKDRFLHKVARLFGRGLACDSEGFPLSEQPGQDDPSAPSTESENELAQCITDLFPTAGETQRIAARRNAMMQPQQHPTQLPSLSKTTLSKGATMHQGAARPPPGRHAGHGHEDVNPDASAAPRDSSPTATQSSLSLSNFASTQLLYSLQSYGLSIDDASLAFQRSGFQAPPQLINQQQQQNGPGSGAESAAVTSLAVGATLAVAGLLATWAV